MAVAPHSLLLIAERVERRLQHLLDEERERWRAVDPALRQPLDSLAELLLASGKRLRPAFCHWGFVVAGGSPEDPRVVDAGAAFELLHAFALFHDDVMDGSATRRGQRTAHLSFADRHREGGWGGEPRRFGEGVAILVGDLALVYADTMLRGAPPAALSIWDDLRVELNVGQYLDLLGTARRDRELATAERVARYKSGKYTVERPLHLGAALADPRQLEQLTSPLSEFGLPLGDAFQLRDDVLGAFGDHRLTGKPVGDDLREGKPTALLATAFARATAAQREVLTGVGGDLDDDAVARIQAVIVDTGALGEIELRIEALAGQALAALAASALEGPAVQELDALARYVAWREQ
jgi:geranylgeranyl diphosphate synthase type I